MSIADTGLIEELLEQLPEEDSQCTNYKQTKQQHKKKESFY